MLPNAEQAELEDAKVRDYLLSQSHPVGRFKSVVFVALGNRHDDWHRLAADLLALAKARVATIEELTHMVRSIR